MNVDAKMPQNHAILSCRNLTFAYGGGRTILENANAEFAPGSFNHIRGASGSGKSTFLRLLNRLEEPDAGAVLFRGKPLPDHSPPALRRSIGYIQQTPTLLPGTVLENITFPFRFRINRDLAAPDEQQIIGLMEEFGIANIRLSEQALDLSGGQKQRVCLLRSLLLDPEVLLLDEPVSALDADSSRAVQSAIVKLNRQRGITVLLASHQPFHTPDVRVAIYEIRNHAIHKGDAP